METDSSDTDTELIPIDTNTERKWGKALRLVMKVMKITSFIFLALFILLNLIKIERKLKQIKYPKKLECTSVDTALCCPKIVYDSTNILSEDLFSAFNEGSFSDIYLKSGSVAVSAHKFVLAARSPVFKLMFSSKPKNQHIYTVNDIDPAILGDLLSFLYGAQVKDLTLLKACDLMDVANKYQIKGLSDFCARHLQSRLSVETALPILECADKYDKNLKQDAIRYISLNFNALKEKEKWKILQSKNSHLAIEVYSELVNSFLQQKI